jgi:ubiquinol-cytochrome c reductase iron-sulfur subunit
MSEKKPERREFLFTASYAVGAVGVGAVVWPLIDQMNPDASVKALASTEVDISSVQPGKQSLYFGEENQFLSKEELPRK